MSEHKDSHPDSTGAAGVAGVSDFWLDADGISHLVESGKVDVFLVRRNDGLPVGPRRHVLRVAAGDLLAELPAAPDSDHAFLAVPLPGARIRPLSRDRLVALASDPIPGDEVRQALERWISRLGEVAARGEPPRSYETVESGQEYAYKSSVALLPLGDVVWVRVLEGGLQFLGEAAIPIEAGDVFPISNAGWLLATPGTRLLALDTAGWLADDIDLVALAALQRATVRQVLARAHEAAATESRRFRAEGVADRESIDAALRSLASPLASSRSSAAVAGAVDPDTWVNTVGAVARSAGVDFELSAERRRDDWGPEPVTAVAEAAGIRVRQVALRSGWHRTDAGPLLAVLTDSQTPVVLEPASARSYRLRDLATGRTVAVTAEVAEELDPFGYTFYRALPSQPLGALGLLAFSLRGARSDLLVILAMGLAAGLLGILLPLAMGIVFDTLIPGALRVEMLQMGVLLFAVAAGTALFRLTLAFALLRVEGRADSALQTALWDRLLRLPVAFFRRFSAGDLAQRGLAIAQIRQIITGSVTAAVFSGIFSIFSYAVLFWFSWRLALVATLLVAIAFVVSLAIGLATMRHERAIADISGDLSGRVLGFLNGIAKLRVSGTEVRAFANWADRFAKERERAVRSRRLTNRLAVFSAVFPVLSLMVIFLAVVMLLGRGPSGLTAGGFIAFHAAFYQLLVGVLGLSAAFVAVLGVVPLYERALPILEALPEFDESKGHPGELTGRVSVRHLNFAYGPDMPLVLRDVSLEIQAGEFVALVGSSGSGKSTLLRLLLGFETPGSGSVYYDDHDLGAVDIREVRRQLGVVLQNGRLMSGSLFTNIVGVRGLTIDDAWEAARLAGFDADVEQMPMGMHTVISEGGGGLSGGQRQRLLIARAIVSRPRILLFDEATSALDNATQATVSRSLEMLKSTRVVIAHRLTTIAKADRIFVLEAGAIVEQGTYAELLDLGGRFADLARRQLT